MPWESPAAVSTTDKGAEMDHRCTRCQRSYKKRAKLRGLLVCPHCNHPEGKQPQSVTRAQNNRYRQMIDFKTRAAGGL